MKVVDIHPEELIDKLTEGSLTIAERERLDAHLAQCASCRFELSVRADLAEDVPAFEERPQLTFAGGAPRERTFSAPPELPVPRISRSVRARSRRRWALLMVAAALVLSAGGAMAAVVTGAVDGHWLGWSPGPKPAESSVSDAKPAAKVKRAVAAKASAVAKNSEPLEGAAPPAASAPLEGVAPPVAPAPATTTQAVALPTRAIMPRPASAALVPAPREAGSAPAPDRGRGTSIGAFPAAPSTVGSADTSTTRADAAALFADANRARRDGNVDRAVGLYKSLQSRYPSSSESELSRALLAQLLLERGNPEAALAGFDRYLAEDAPVLGAEALVGRARALEQLGKSTQAAAAWRQVQSRFPGSVHARLAATRLAALGMR